MRRRRKSEAGKKSNVIFRITSRWMLLLLRSSIERQCHWRGETLRSKGAFKKKITIGWCLCDTCWEADLPSNPFSCQCLLLISQLYMNVWIVSQLLQCAVHTEDKKWRFFFLLLFLYFLSWKKLQLWISSRVVFIVRGVCHTGQNLGKDTSVVWMSAKG